MDQDKNEDDHYLRPVTQQQLTTLGKPGSSPVIHIHFPSPPSGIDAIRAHPGLMTVEDVAAALHTTADVVDELPIPCASLHGRKLFSPKAVGDYAAQLLETARSVWEAERLLTESPVRARSARRAR